MRHTNKDIILPKSVLLGGGTARDGRLVNHRAPVDDSPLAVEPRAGEINRQTDNTTYFPPAWPSAGILQSSFPSETQSHSGVSPSHGAEAEAGDGRAARGYNLERDLQHIPPRPGLLLFPHHTSPTILYFFPLPEH